VTRLVFNRCPHFYRWFIAAQFVRPQNLLTRTVLAPLTKVRSQLLIQKVRKMNIEHMELKSNHEGLGLTTDDIRRKFVKFAEECVVECQVMTRRTRLALSSTDPGSGRQHTDG
jgi:hypothetical protein